MEAKWERDRLVWISNKKIVELGTNPSDKMLHKTVLVRNTHSALTSWDREEAGKKSGSNYCFWKSDFKQGVKDGKLKLWRPHCRRKRRQWKREVSINVTKLAKQFGTFKVKSIKKRNKMCVGSLCKRISARMKADQRQCWNITVMILEHSHTWTRRKESRQSLKIELMKCSLVE